jgi:hypothetical protein
VFEAVTLEDGLEEVVEDWSLFCFFGAAVVEDEALL